MSSSKHDCVRRYFRRIKKKSSEIGSEQAEVNPEINSKIKERLIQVAIKEAPTHVLPVVKLPNIESIKEKTESITEVQIEPEPQETKVQTFAIIDENQNEFEIVSEHIEEKAAEVATEPQLSNAKEIVISEPETQIDKISEEIAEDFETESKDLSSEILVTNYNTDFFTQILIELANEYRTKGESLLCNIIAQCKVSLQQGKLTLQVPMGFKNESVDKERLMLKRYFVSKIPDLEFELEIEEIKIDFKSEIPYSTEDKINAMLKENPSIGKWFEKLDLKPL